MVTNESRAGERIPQEFFEERLRAEAMAHPAKREFIAQLLRQLREFDRVSPWPESAVTGESPIRLYWRLWRVTDQPNGFEVLCGRCAPQLEVAQRKQGVRPAFERDFMYLDTLPPTCARCGWTNEGVRQRREKAHEAERAWRAKEADRG